MKLNTTHYNIFKRAIVLLSKNRLLLSLVFCLPLSAVLAGSPAGIGDQADNVLWLRADQGITLNADKVSQWSDISGNNNHAFQLEESKRPTLQLDAINGLPALQFGGTNINLEINDDNSLDGMHGLTIFVVAQPDNIDTQPRGLISKRVSHSSQNAYSLFTYSNRRLYFDSPSRMNGNTSATDDVQIFSALFNGSDPSTRSRVFQNGLETGAANAGSNTQIPETNSQLYIGILDDNYGHAFRGNMAEIIVYNRALNFAERIIVDTYLAHRHGIDLTVSGFSSTTHVEDFVGIGHANGHKYTQTQNTGSGLVLSENNNSLDEAYEFVFAGHDGTAHGTNNNNLPSLEDINIDQRWNRVYYIERRQNGVIDEGTTDINLNFHFNEAGITADAGRIYMLLYRENAGEIFTHVPGGYANISNGVARFSVSDEFFKTGYYTIARSDLESLTYYSYNGGGNWTDLDFWSLNPDSPQPPSRLPGPTDRVVIQDNHRVTVNSNDLEVGVLDVRNGVIDFGTTSGHIIPVITGQPQGIIELYADNFPHGDASGFAHPQTGGTVRYKGAGYELHTPRTFRNMTIDLTDSAGEIFLMADYHLNGNLNIVRGTLNFGKDNQETPRNLTVREHLNVFTLGRIRTATGNTRHQLNLFGDFINEGDVQFTNRTEANFTSQASDGIVDVNFRSGTRNQSLDIRGPSRFYRIAIEKGLTSTYELHIFAQEPGQFELLGWANEGHPDNPQLTINHNSLGLAHGTVRIGQNIIIPRLNGSGNYNVSENAVLWVDGGSVTKPSGTAVVVYGKVKITDGNFNANINSGITTRHNGVFESLGGTTVLGQFRTSIYGTQHVGGYIQKGGDVTINGSSSANSYYSFTLSYEGNVFELTGGTLTINGTNTRGAIFINSDPENQTVNHLAHLILIERNNRTFKISSRAPLPNVTMQSNNSTVRNFELSGGLVGTNASNQAELPALPLITKGNLVLEDNIVFDPKGLDVTIGQGLYVRENAKYLAGSNNTIFTGTTQGYTISIHTSATNYFHDLTIHNPGFTGTLQTSHITVGNDLFVHPNSVFHTGTRVVTVRGNIINSGTIMTGTSGKVLVTDRGRVHTIELTDGGSYESAPLITVESPETGTQATAVAVFNGTPSSSNPLPINKIVITNTGSGYTTPPNVSFGSGDAEATAVIGTTHELGGNGNGVFGNLEIDENHPSDLSEEITFLSAKQTVTGTMTLTNGIFDLKAHNLVIEGTLHDNTIDYYSNERMFRTEGNHGDGGLTRTISANGTYLFPIGTINNDEDAYRYAWANPTFSNVTGSGKVQINGVPRKLGTLGDENPKRYLKYYWRVRHSGFPNNPYIHNQFLSYESDYTSPFNFNNAVVGKVIGLVRYPTEQENDNEWGSLQNLGDEQRLLNYARNDGNPTPLEVGEFTSAFKPFFNGTIRVFYSRTNSSSWYDVWWDINEHWSFEPHNGSVPDNRVAAGDYPRTGDIAIIGYGGHNNRGGYHSINIRDHIEVGKIEFVPHPNPPEDARISRVVINQSGSNDGTLDAGVVEGPGVFTVYNYSTAANGFPAISADFSEFNLSDKASFHFCPSGGGFHTIPNISGGVFPNLRLEGGSATMNYDFWVRNNFTIDGDGEFVTHDGENGDILVSGSLLLGDWRGGILSFNTSGAERTVEVGNLKFNYRGNNPGSARSVQVLKSNPGGLTHRLIVNGDIIKDIETTNNSLDLFSDNSTGNNVILELNGDENAELLMPDTDPDHINLYRVLVNKGNSNTTSFTFNSAFTLGGPTDGISSEKALQLQNGRLILNHPDIDINLSSGGGNFEIPGSTALVVRQGQVNVTGANTGILLDGLLRAENTGFINLDGGSGANNYIQYSASGRARLEIAGNAKVVAGSQIRRGTTNPSGVLRYIQTGGTLTVGKNNTGTTSRGVLEILNTGSQFHQIAGTINILASNSSQMALWLEPSLSAVRGTINFGDEDQTPTGTSFNVNSNIPLGHVNVSGPQTQLVLKERDLTINGNLHIDAHANLNGSDGENKRNLILRGHFTHDNIEYTHLNVDTLFFRGISSSPSSSLQEVDGFITTNHLWIEPEISVQLRDDSGITVKGELNLVSGQFLDGGNTITVEKDVRNHSIHISDKPDQGGLRFAGSSTQLIHGQGQFGRIDIANRVELQGNMSLSHDLTLSNGILFLGQHLLTLSQDTEVISGGEKSFGPDNMIAVAAEFTQGVKKQLPVVNGGIEGDFDPYDPEDPSYGYSFIFPVGADDGGSTQRYLPVEFFVANNSSGGSIRIIPNNNLHITLDDGVAERKERVLHQYWNIRSNGIADFIALQRNHYTQDAVKIPDNDINFIGARLLDDLSWEKFQEIDDLVIVNEEQNYINFTHSNVVDISGDYTAGEENWIPDNVPTYTSVKEDAHWTDATAWTRDDGLDVPEGGPTGQRIHVLEGHVMRIEDNARRSYQTQIDGRLEVGTTLNHILGYVAGTGTIAVERGSLPTGDYTHFFTPGNGSTVEFGGNISYNLPSRNYYNNLVLRGSGDRTLPNDAGFTINGNWISQDDVYIKLQNDIRVNGDMEWRDNVYLLTSHEHHIDFYGENITKSNDATYDAERNHTLRLHGSHDKTITGVFNSPHNRFNNLYIYNGAHVFLYGDINLRADLGLYHASRIMAMPDFTLTLDKSEPFESISSGSYIQGVLSRNLSAGSNHHFPLGHNGGIREVYLHDVSLSGYYTVHYRTGMAFDAGAMDDLLELVSDTEYWALEAPSGSTAKVQLSWGPGSKVPEVEPHMLEQYMAVAQWNNDKWIAKGNAAAQANGDMTGWVKAADATEFIDKSSIRYLTLASTNEELVPLPIELLSFTAQLDGDMVQLEWVTATETLNDFFTIERSRDGQNFEVVAVIASQAENGYSTQPLHYMALDTQPMEGMNYYRLKQTDFDGSYEYSELIGVMYKKTADVVFNLFPNPNKGNAFHIALNGLRAYESLEISITSLQGRRVYHTHISANEAGSLHSYIVPTGRIPAGVYLVTVTGNSGRFVVRMVVS